MGRFLKTAVIAIAAMTALSCNNKTAEMGTYGYDKQFLKEHSIRTIDLKSEDGKSLVMVVPAWQGRVMTSSADGEGGDSYGWINYRFIEEGKVSPQFNPYGGEERLWFGPEGGPFSWYFKKGQEQVYENWKVPAIEDTEAFKVVESSDTTVRFTASTKLVNASDHAFDMDIERQVVLINREHAGRLLGIGIPRSLKYVGYVSRNSIINRGETAWTEQTGEPSIWMLGCFNPTTTTTVVIPYNKDYEGVPVKDDYFGKVPSDRLIVKDGLVRFRIDGKYRSKIGLPKGSATEFCGSWDSDKKVLTVLKYTVPNSDDKYVNSQWGPQDDPLKGDVINSYNDGPTETGYVQGPFYEIETSSPGAALAPNEVMYHEQFVCHIQGEESVIDPIARTLFGVSLSDIASSFDK